MITPEVLSLSKKVWDYHHMGHHPQPSDCILVLGSHDTRVAERGAALYLEGYAPLLIMSGGLGRLTNGVWKQREADLFAQIAIDKGVPAQAIMVENNSTNTGENIIFTAELLRQKNIDPQSFILVQKPYMERRSFATFKKHLPDKTVYVTSPQISFEDYPTDEFPMEKVISIMVGDLQRIRTYAKKGFQIEQEIPTDVWLAYERLVELGFTEHVIAE